jgi:hypothetical protein
VAIAALTVAIVWTAAGRPTLVENGPEASASPTAIRPSPTPVLPPEPVTSTHLDQVVGPGGPPEPTDHGAQSKLWVAEGSWWAAMFEPHSRTWHIYELVADGASWRDTGTVIDDRANAQPDCLWDVKHQRLYIVSATSSKTQTGGARLSRYRFDPTSRIFRLDPNFPVRISDTGIDRLVLTQDGTGKLWTTWIDDNGQVMVNRSTDNDLLWGQPFALPAAGSLVTTDDVAAAVAFGPGKVGILWSSRSLGAFYLASHEDGDPDAAWGPPETAASGQALAGGELKAVAAPDGNLFVTVRTALDDDPSSSSAGPQILLLQRPPTAAWTTTLAGRILDQLTGPLVALDGSSGTVYVMATTPKRGGAIAYKRTLATSPSFASGSGKPLVFDPAATGTQNGTTTKDVVSRDTGLVVLAYDPDTTRYLHGIVDLGGGVAAGPAAPTPTGPQVIFADDFDPWPLGPATQTGWELRPTDPPRALVIRQAPSNETPSAALLASSAGQDVRACKSFDPIVGGDVTVDVRVRLSRIGATDAVITEVRAPGAVTASVRFGRSSKPGVVRRRPATFSYYRGSTEVRTAVRYRPGAWYRSVVVVHLATRTYDWRVLDATGRQLLVVKGVPWRDAGKVAPDRVCLKTPTGGPGMVLDWDDPRVIH